MGGGGTDIGSFKYRFGGTGTYCEESTNSFEEKKLKVPVMVKDVKIDPSFVPLSNVRNPITAASIPVHHNPKMYCMTSTRLTPIQNMLNNMLGWTMENLPRGQRCD